jgi:hypothetical protein
MPKRAPEGEYAGETRKGWGGTRGRRRYLSVSGTRDVRMRTSEQKERKMGTALGKRGQAGAKIAEIGDPKLVTGIVFSF